MPLKKLILRGNKIGNVGIVKLCKTIEEAHKTKLEYLDLGQNEFTDTGAEALYNLKKRMKSMKTLLIDGNDKLSEETKNRLHLICEPQ